MEEFALDSLAASIVLLFVAPSKNFLYLWTAILTWNTLTWATSGLTRSLWLSTTAIWVIKSATMASCAVWKISAIWNYFLRVILVLLLKILLWIWHSILIASSHVVLHLVRHLTSWHLVWHLHLSWHTTTLSLLIYLLTRQQESK